MQRYEDLSKETNQLSREITDCAYQVHSHLGPGLLESVYEVCLCHELSKRRIPFMKQMHVPVCYDGLEMETGFRIDIMVDDKIIIELKTTEKLTSLHDAQLLTYLKITGKRLGLLINFNSTLIKNGIKRIIL